MPSARHVRDLRDEDLHDILTAFYETVEKDALLAPAPFRELPDQIAVRRLG